MKKNKRTTKTPQVFSENDKESVGVKSKINVFPPIEANKTNSSFRKPVNVALLNKSKGETKSESDNQLNKSSQKSDKSLLPSLPNINFSMNVNNESKTSNSNKNNFASENIKVCLRIRPFSKQEENRHDDSCIEKIEEDRVNFYKQSTKRSYSFNLVFGPEDSQEDIFYTCSINKLLDSALNGYSVTIFAYGQTGSGKTYTIMGREDSINENVLSNDTYSGIMPKSVKYIWTAISQRKEKYYVKVSFLEIYNEQIRDLLNPDNVNLQIRWDNKQGFFVEGLLVIECKSPEDVVEVILQGTKNRKKGSHELNKDSSRSHCILTLYVISEFSGGEENFKKFGKVSFVDLAGSERLKETKSTGVTLKESGNINRSLFVLGKVIAALTESRSNSLQTHSFIPYRDSKLTMLLMDSIGGTAKTLMIACVSPSEIYADETMSTLNYASRAMNIKNRPEVQMDGKVKNLEGLRRDNEEMKGENEFLKNQFLKVFGMVPDIANGGLNNHELELIKVQMGIKDDEEMNDKIRKLKEENDFLRNEFETQEKENKNLHKENVLLKAKVDNLENVFFGSKIMNKEEKKGIVVGNEGDVDGEDFDNNYNASSMMLENKELKKIICSLEQDNLDLKEVIARNQTPNISSFFRKDAEIDIIRQQNEKLTKRVEFMQGRERELLERIVKLKDNEKVAIMPEILKFNGI